MDLWSALCHVTSSIGHSAVSFQGGRSVSSLLYF